MNVSDAEMYAFALKTLFESAINAMDLSPLQAMGGTITVDLVKSPRLQQRIHCYITVDLEPKP